jgi:hypothetical protein
MVRHVISVNASESICAILNTLVEVEYPLSEILKSENLQNPKCFARWHEHSAVQM